MRRFVRTQIIKIKELADIEAVASDLGLEPRWDRRISRYPLIRCPACGGRKAYLVTDARVQSGPQKWGCFQCRASGDVIDLVRAAEGLGFVQAANRVMEICGIHPGDIR